MTPRLNFEVQHSLVAKEALFMIPSRISRIALLLCFLFPACQRTTSHTASPYLREHIGEICTVQFRRDALGSGATLPVSPTTGSINGAEVAVGGKLVAVEGDGIVIEGLPPHQANTYWIPFHAILLVEVPKKR